MNPLKKKSKEENPLPTIVGGHFPPESKEDSKMNRENKRKQYDKGYYKTHPCNETFTCKNCGRLVVPEGAGSNHRNHCPNCLYSLHVDIEPGDRESDCGGHMSANSKVTATSLTPSRLTVRNPPEQDA